MKRWTTAKSFTGEEDVLVNWPPKALNLRIMQNWDMSEDESIRDPLYLFNAFSLFPPSSTVSAHTASSNAPAILPTHRPRLTQSWPRALWFKRDANQPSPRERSFLHLSPVSPRYITSCLWGMCVPLDIFWQISEKLSARLPAPSLAKIRVGLTPQGMLWTRKNVT